jgi:hypothetical protein
MRTALQNLYGNINNLDVYIAGLAENHVPGGSLGPLFTEIVQSQFLRLRDGDRLFYRANAADLYLNGVLRPEIASIINLNTVRLADILAWNAGLNSLQYQGNVFFALTPGDVNRSGAVTVADIDAVRTATAGAPTTNGLLDTNADGVVTPTANASGSDLDHLVRNLILTDYGDTNLDRTINIADFAILATNFNAAGGWAVGNFNGDSVINIADFSLLAANFNRVFTSTTPAAVPEPALLSPLALAVCFARRRRQH